MTVDQLDARMIKVESAISATIARLHAEMNLTTAEVYTVLALMIARRSAQQATVFYGMELGQEDQEQEINHVI